MANQARALIEKLALAPHPEGGWFRETWRDPARPRARGTAILFLLEADQRSHWHRVDADELWLWHAGAALWLGEARAGGEAVAEVTLGPDVLGGQTPQHRIAAGHWQAAEARSGWALVSCVVVPGFEFAGFELAAPGWQP